LLPSGGVFKVSSLSKFLMFGFEKFNGTLLGLVGEFNTLSKAVIHCLFQFLEHKLQQTQLEKFKVKNY